VTGFGGGFQGGVAHHIPAVAPEISAVFMPQVDHLQYPVFAGGDTLQPYFQELAERIQGCLGWASNAGRGERTMSRESGRTETCVMGRGSGERDRAGRVVCCFPPPPPGGKSPKKPKKNGPNSGISLPGTCEEAKKGSSVMLTGKKKKQVLFPTLGRATDR